MAQLLLCKVTTEYWQVVKSALLFSLIEETRTGVGFFLYPYHYLNFLAIPELYREKNPAKIFFYSPLQE